jgi:hypothetical protein
MAYLDPKGEGDQSMPGKQRPCPGVRARAAAGPAEYGESWIARSQISSRCKPPSTGKTSEPVLCPVSVSHICRRNLRGAGRCPVRVFKEMSWPPTFRSTRTTGTNEGSPTGRESYGDGGLVVVVGVASGQGVRESRTQGEAGQVTGTPPDRQVGAMPNAEPVVDVRRERLRAYEMVAGEPVAGKAGTAGSGRGPLEKDPIRAPRQRPTGTAL